MIRHRATCQCRDCECKRAAYKIYFWTLTTLIIIGSIVKAITPAF